MKTQTLIDQFKAARLAGAPIIAINTPDPAATIEAIRTQALNGKADVVPLVAWDVVNGIHGLNDAGKSSAGAVNAEDTKFNPIVAAIAAGQLLGSNAPAQGTILFFHLANRYLVEAGSALIQAIWNLRDTYKQTSRTIVLMGPAVQLPPELAGDTVVLDEPLPKERDLATIVREIFAAAEQDPTEPTVTRAVEAITGLPAFAAEQCTAMSMKRTGLDLDGLWERKRQMIDNTPGLRVFRDTGSLEDIGGVGNIKHFIAKIMSGRSRPNAVVFIDEIEKMLAGAGGDTSGVTQDQLGVVLSYMQDNAAAGMIFIGPPGSAKSMVAKAAGNVAGVPTIQLDLGGLKGSLVGQSEQQLRAALKVITAVSNGRSLWIATCNSIGSLPPELRRRFTLGTFFFDLPDADERAAIWDLYQARYETVPCKRPADEGWTGAEIRQCCELAWRLDCTLDEAAGFIVPVSRSAADQLEKLRAQADGKFLHASKPGLYSRQKDTPADSKPKPRRKLEVQE